jgi:hypothetical protein
MGDGSGFLRGAVVGMVGARRLRTCLLAVVVFLVLSTAANAQLFYDRRTGRDIFGNSAESAALNGLAYHLDRVAVSQEHLARTQERLASACETYIPLSILGAGSMASLALLMQRKSMKEAGANTPDLIPRPEKEGNTSLTSG